MEKIKTPKWSNRRTRDSAPVKGDWQGHDAARGLTMRASVRLIGSMATAILVSSRLGAQDSFGRFALRDL